MFDIYGIVYRVSNTPAATAYMARNAATTRLKDRVFSCYLHNLLKGTLACQCVRLFHYEIHT